MHVLVVAALFFSIFLYLHFRNDQVPAGLCAIMAAMWLLAEIQRNFHD